MTLEERWLVLIVDDSVDDRADVRRMLLQGAERRLRFFEAETGVHAQEQLQRLAADGLTPDVVLLDYHLPDADAPEILQSVFCRAGRMPVCPVVVLTGSAGREAGTAVLRAGAQDFVCKRGLSAETLTRAVENALDRWRLASELEESRERLRLALEAANTGLWDWDIASGRVSWSPQCYDIHGLVPGTFVGTAEAFDALVHPEDRAQLWRLVSAAAAAGTRYSHEFRIVRPDGEVRWVQNLARALGSAGEAQRMVGTIVDITERKRTEQALAESEQRFRAVADQAPVVMWVANENGGGEFVNRAYGEFFGVGVHDIKGNAWQAVVHPDDGHYLQGFFEALQRRGPYRAEGRVRRADGEWRTVVSIGEPRYDAAGRFAGLIGVNHDVTEQRLAAASLHEAARQKDEFIALLAHELRNPLAPIRTAAGVLASLSGSDPTLTRCVGILERQVAQMARLVDDLLDVSRLSRGTLVLRRQTTVLGEALRAAVEAAGPIIIERRHVLQLHEPETPVMLDADGTRLTQVFTNLLNNAAKFTEPGGRIDVRVETKANQVRIAVRDSGVGIAPALRDRVFELFIQADPAHGYAPGGLGIGLNLCQRLVQLHSGTLELTDTKPGHGSEFTVTLPTLINQTPLPPPTKVTAAEEAAAGATLRVLVADDNVDAADSLAMLLGSYGWRVLTTYDGETAVREAESFAPDVVLLDLGMPGLGGEAACKRLREQSPAGAEMMILALTGWGQDEDRRRTRMAGFDEHLVKPVDADQLVRLIRERTAAPAS